MSKILVVDDEQGILDLLIDDLSAHGFNVISATTGAAALVQIYRERPDLVVLDLMLPVVNGYQVLRELKSNPTTKNLPVIMLTAISSEHVEKSLRQMGADNYLTKPWKLDSLLTEINSALSMSDQGLSAA